MGSRRVTIRLKTCSCILLGGRIRKRERKKLKRLESEVTLVSFKKFRGDFIS